MQNRQNNPETNRGESNETKIKRRFIILSEIQENLPNQKLFRQHDYFSDCLVNTKTSQKSILTE